MEGEGTTGLTDCFSGVSASLVKGVTAGACTGSVPSREVIDHGGATQLAHGALLRPPKLLPRRPKATDVYFGV